MSELSDYKRLIEAPATRSYEATIASLRSEVETLKTENESLRSRLSLTTKIADGLITENEEMSKGPRICL